MNKDLIIKIPMVSQTEDTKNKKWVPKTCAICSLKMLLTWKNAKAAKIPVMKLVNEALALDGYIKDIGWKHRAIVDLAAKHGLKMNFAEKFFKSKNQKEEGLVLINKKLKAGKPVLVSVFYKFEKKKGGHIVVVNGFRKDGNRMKGYFIQDPHPEFKGHNYFVPKTRFVVNWRGGLIYLV